MAQGALGAFSWMMLALAVGNLLNKWPRILAVGAILLLSLVSPITSWNSFALTESLAISSATLWLACVLWLFAVLRCESHHANLLGRTALLATSTVFALLARPQLMIMILLPTAMMIVWALRVDEHDRKPLLRVLVASIPIAVTVWAIAALARTNGDPSLRYWYALNNAAQKQGFRNWVLQQSPPCALLNSNTGWEGITPLRSELQVQCEGTHAYLIAHGSGLHWLLSEPATVLTEFATVASGLWPLAIVGEQPPMLPAPFNNLFLGSTGMLQNFMWPLVAAIVLGMIAVKPSKATFDWRGAVLAVSLVVSTVLLIFFSWLMDGMEELRHVIPGSTLIPVVCFLIPVLAFSGRGEVSVAQESRSDLQETGRRPDV